MNSLGKSLLPRSMEAITALSNEQLSYLDRVWRESLPLEHCRWIDCFDFYNWFDTKAVALDILKSIGGSFIHDGDRGSGANKAYCLTLLGILACPSFERRLTNIIRVLEHLKSIAQSSEYPIKIPDKEMCIIAGVTEAGLDEIAQFFYRSHQISSLIHQANGIWYVEKREIVTDLRSANSASEFLDELAISNFNPDEPVHRADRDKQYITSTMVDKTELLYLIIRYLSLDKALHSRAKRSARRLINLLRIAISGIIGLVMQTILDNVLFSVIGTGIAFFLIGILPSIEEHLGSRIKQLECRLTSKRFRKILEQAHGSFLSDRKECIKSASNQIEVLSWDKFSSILSLSFTEQELFGIDIEYLMTPPQREQ